MSVVIVRLIYFFLIVVNKSRVRMVQEGQVSLPLICMCVHGCALGRRARGGDQGGVGCRCLSGADVEVCACV